MFRQSVRFMGNDGASVQACDPSALAWGTTSSTYPGSTEHISAVRASLRPVVRGCPIADDVILCASELAANAVLHSHSGMPGGKFIVRAKVRAGDYAWIEVEDNGGRWTCPVPGRGLDIVRALASVWGIDGDYRSRCIWARFDWPHPGWPPQSREYRGTSGRSPNSQDVDAGSDEHEGPDNDDE
jgi:hypothetical protein